VLGAETFIVRTPIADGEVKNAGHEGSSLRIASISEKSFSKIIRKKIDERKTILLYGTLSLIGKLFEIYFVRLIGTPNQQFNIVSKM
jgi:hypothetical protein